MAGKLNATERCFISRRTWQGNALIKTLRAYADRLIGFSVSSKLAELRLVAQDTKARFLNPPQWANESYEIAATVIYKRLATSNAVLPISYQPEMLPIVNEQLQRAGVRLAAILSAVLGFPD